MGWGKNISLFMGVTAFGIFLAAIIYELDNQGILVDEFVTGSIVVTDIMVVVVLLFMIIGGVLAVVTR